MEVLAVVMLRGRVVTHRLIRETKSSRTHEIMKRNVAIGLWGLSFSLRVDRGQADTSLIAP